MAGGVHLILIIIGSISLTMAYTTIRAEDLPSSRIDIPAIIQFECESALCEYSFEVRSSDNNYPMFCIKFIWIKGKKMIMESRMSCLVDAGSVYSNDFWDVASLDKISVWFRSFSQTVELKLNQRGRMRKTLTVYGAIGTVSHTVVTNIKNNGALSIGSVCKYNPCYVLVETNWWHRVQASDVILLKQHRRFTNIQVNISRLATSECEGTDYISGKGTVPRGEWSRLALYNTNDANGNTSIRLNDQEIFTMDTSNKQCKGRAWYMLNIENADVTLNCSPTQGRSC